MADNGKTWSERAEVMFVPGHSGGEETTLSALPDGTLIAGGNGGASVYRSTDHGYTWQTVLNQSQLTAMSGPIGWDGNSLAYGAVSVSESDAAKPGTLPEGVYIFSGNRVLRSTDSAASFVQFARATARPGTSLARGNGFFEQSELFLRKDGTLLHGTRWNVNGSWDECAGSQLWQSLPLTANHSTGNHSNETLVPLEFACRTQPAAGYCRLNTSDCSATSQQGPPQCDK